MSNTEHKMIKLRQLFPNGIITHNKEFNVIFLTIHRNLEHQKRHYPTKLIHDQPIIFDGFDEKYMYLILPLKESIS